MIFFLMLAGVGFAAVSPVQEDAAKSFEEKVRKQLGAEGARFFKDSEFNELAALAVSRVSKLKDPSQSSKLLQDTGDFLKQHYADFSLVHVDPDQGDGGIRVMRSPASWQLFKEDLSARMDWAAAAPKPAEIASQVEEQIDRLAIAARIRLGGIFTGPGAPEYIDETTAAFKRNLLYQSRSGLEFSFSRPLGTEELQQIEHQIATYVPPESIDPKYKDKTSQIEIRDAKKPPYICGFITTSGVFRQVGKSLGEIYRPDEFWSPEVAALKEKSDREYDDLSRDIQDRAALKAASSKSGLPAPGDSARPDPGRPPAAEKLPQIPLPAPSPGDLPGKDSPPPSGRTLTFVVVAGALVLIAIVVARGRKS